MKNTSKDYKTAKHIYLKYEKDLFDSYERSTTRRWRIAGLLLLAGLALFIVGKVIGNNTVCIVGVLCWAFIASILIQTIMDFSRKRELQDFYERLRNDDLKENELENFLEKAEALEQRQKDYKNNDSQFSEIRKQRKSKTK